MVVAAAAVVVVVVSRKMEALSEPEGFVSFCRALECWLFGWLKCRRSNDRPAVVVVVAVGVVVVGVDEYYYYE